MQGTRPRSCLGSSVTEGWQAATQKCTPWEPHHRGMMGPGICRKEVPSKGRPTSVGGEGVCKACETRRKKGQRAGLGSACNSGCVDSGCLQGVPRTGERLEVPEFRQEKC